MSGCLTFSRGSTRALLLLMAAVSALPLLAATGRIDTYASYELRIQRMETVWPDARAVTSRQPGGTYAIELYDAVGNKVGQRFITPSEPVVPQHPAGEAVR